MMRFYRGFALFFASFPQVPVYNDAADTLTVLFREGLANRFNRHHRACANLDFFRTVRWYLLLIHDFRLQSVVIV